MHLDMADRTARKQDLHQRPNPHALMQVLCTPGRGPGDARVALVVVAKGLPPCRKRASVQSCRGRPILVVPPTPSHCFGLSYERVMRSSSQRSSFDGRPGKEMGDGVMVMGGGGGGGAYARFFRVVWCGV